MKKVAVIVSGCGVFDGAEIHESVMTLFYLQKSGAQITGFAPDIEQTHVIDHVTMNPQDGERRNVLKESARLFRGEIKSLSDMEVDMFDAIVLPGGAGTIKNLSSFAFEGPGSSIDPQIRKVIQDAHSKGKVIGAVCISPVVVALALKDKGAEPRLTIGNDKEVSGALKSLGAVHVETTFNEIVVDERNRIVSTPAYMVGKNINEVAEGIEKLVTQVLEMA